MIILSTKRYYHIIFLLSYSFYYHDNSVDKSDDNVYDFEYHDDDGGDRHRHHDEDGDFGW